MRCLRCVQCGPLDAYLTTWLSKKFSSNYINHRTDLYLRHNQNKPPQKNNNKTKNPSTSRIKRPKSTGHLLITFLFLKFRVSITGSVARPFGHSVVGRQLSLETCSVTTPAIPSGLHRNRICGTRYCYDIFANIIL